MVSSYWVCFGVFVSSRSRKSEFWGPFWGYLWVFWVFRGFRGVLLGLRWVSVEFPLGSHWFHLIGFVLGSLSLPGPERVSFGVLFGVIYGFFGFLGGSG